MDPLLPYPLVVRREHRLHFSEEYLVPAEHKAAVLRLLYPCPDVPAMKEKRFDLKAQRNFVVAECRIIREGGVNLLVSPYYYEGGGTILDWMPAR